MFKYSVFTENTTEMREWLEKIGYKDELQLKHPTPNTIITCNTLSQYAQFYTGNTERNIKEAYPDLVDCLGNPSLFKAVTAMRDDSDYMQWFVIDRINAATEEYETRYRLCKTEKMEEDSLPYANVLSCKKATLEELIDHFK